MYSHLYLHALSDCPHEKTRLLKMKWSGFRIEKVIFTVLFSRVKEQTILTVVEKCFYPKLPRSNKLLNRNIRHKAIILTSPLEITPSPKSRADEGGRKFRLRLTQFPKIRDDENRVPFLSVSLTSADEGTSKARKMQRQFLLPREHSVLWIPKCYVQTQWSVHDYGNT